MLNDWFLNAGFYCIGEFLRLISGILEHTNNNGIEAVLFQWILGRLSTSLFSVLKSYKLGPDFIRLVKTLFSYFNNCALRN